MRCGWAGCRRRSGRSRPRRGARRGARWRCTRGSGRSAPRVLVERVVEDLVAGAARRARGGARGRPTIPWYRAWRPTARPGADAGALRRPRPALRVRVAETLQAERVGQPARRVDGEYEHLAPVPAAAMAAAAAAVVVLPTPPGPHETTISCAASSRVERGTGLSARSPSGSSVPELLGERLGDLPGRAQPMGPGEQVRDVQQRQAGSSRRGGARGASARCGATSPPDGRPASRGRVATGGSAAAAARRSGSHSRSKTSSSPRPNSSGSTRLTTTPARSTLVSPSDALDELERFVDRHLLGRRHDEEPGRERVRQDLEHPVGLERNRPTWTKALMACGAASWPTMWPVAEASTTTRSYRPSRTS